MGTQDRQITSATVPRCPSCRRVPGTIAEPMAGNSFYYLEETPDGWVLLAIENDGVHGTAPCWARCNGPDGCGHQWTFRGQFAKLDKWSE